MTKMAKLGQYLTIPEEKTMIWYIGIAGIILTCTGIFWANEYRDARRQARIRAKKDAAKRDTIEANLRAELEVTRRAIEQSKVKHAEHQAIAESARAKAEQCADAAVVKYNRLMSAERWDPPIVSWIVFRPDRMDGINGRTLRFGLVVCVRGPISVCPIWLDLEGRVSTGLRSYPLEQTRGEFDDCIAVGRDGGDWLWQLSVKSDLPRIDPEPVKGTAWMLNVNGKITLRGPWPGGKRDVDCSGSMLVKMKE